jgi:hypothetical protein
MVMALYAATQNPCFIESYGGCRVALILPGLFHHWEPNQ